MRYEARKNARIKNFGFSGIYNLGDFWYVKGDKELVMNFDGRDCCNYIPCRSLRRYRKLLKKFPELKGTTLLHKYRGLDIYQ